MHKSNRDLYYQVKRLKNTRDKLATELENEKIKNEVVSFFRKEDTIYLKNMIIIQASGLALIGFIYITKMFM